MSDLAVQRSDAARSSGSFGNPIEHRLASLNPMQRLAAETLEGPVLMLAGAGTGKTTALTTRLANLLASDVARPWSVLAVTFTNKAAQEMRERVADLVGDAAAQVWLGTFHAMCARMLRRDAERVGLKQNFTILDTGDQLRLVKRILQDLNINDLERPPQDILQHIQRWKDRALEPGDVPAEQAEEIANGRGRDVYATYQDQLRTLNSVDFGDLILHSLNILRHNPDVLARYHRQFSHILVDEYQDTNIAQYLWLRLLAQDRRNICCVGDDDQSIYGWRGAEVGNILKFEEDFPGATVVRLEQNYRSTSRILSVAGSLISRNLNRHKKTLWTDGSTGNKIILRCTDSDLLEAMQITSRVMGYRAGGVAFGEMAVLVRTAFQTRTIEDSFLGQAIPYRLIGGPRFYERMEIRDAIAYLRVIHQPDDDLALERIINKPRRGIGRTTLHQVFQYRNSTGTSLWNALVAMVENGQLRPAVRKKMAGLIDDFGRWRERETSGRPDDLVQVVLDQSGYTGMLEDDPAPEAEGRLENLGELINATRDFENIADFLEHVSLVMENADDGNTDQVSIMTMHAAKGLEFDVVFLPGWEDGLFPHRRALESESPKALEEERRLAYVSVTRARRAVEISFCQRRMTFGQTDFPRPSRFVFELPAPHIEPQKLLPEIWSRIRKNSAAHAAQSGLATTGSTPESRQATSATTGSASESRQGAPAGRKRRSPTRIRRTTSPVETYASGDRVFNQKLGMGTVIAVEADKVDVEFDHAGQRKVLANFLSRP